MAPNSDGSDRGLLVSVEGLSGVGKTYLTTMLFEQLSAHDRPLLVPEFSKRSQSPGHDLGSDLLRALRNAANGDHFLRGGHPAAETLLLLAIKMNDWENYCLPALRNGRLVLEGRSVHSTAVYQSLIMNPDDDTSAFRQARGILALAKGWRPLPDLTILLIDDMTIALRRAERRDKRTYTPEQWHLHGRAAALFERLAETDPQRMLVLDRRSDAAEETVKKMVDMINVATSRRPTDKPDL